MAERHLGDGRWQGWRDVPADLSDHDQIARLSAHLPDQALLISSDLIRSIATADALAHPARRRLAHDPALRELDFGEWDGLDFREVSARDPDLSRAYWETPGDIAPPNGESWNAVAARVSAAIDGYLALGLPDLIVVGHFGMILTQVQRALSITPYEAFGHRIDNLSVTEIKTVPWSAERINHKP